MYTDKADRKAVCIYCDTWAQGGIEMFITGALLHMETDALRFRLVCAEKEGAHFDVQLEERGLSVHPLQKRQQISALEKTLRTAAPLAKLCRREHIGVVHLNVFHGVSLIQALFLKLCGVRHVIVHCHGSGLRESGGKWIKLLGHRICRRLLFWTADERWASSEQAAHFLFGDRRARIIPNGIETERFLYDPEKRTRLRKELNVENQLLLGCVGRLDTQKNQQFLLTVLADLKNRGKNAALLLVGDGEEYGTLRWQAERLGISEDVIFLGISDRVGDWMCAMDVLLVPSTSEGLSIAAIEGQASGLPVLCSTGVPKEVQISARVHFLPLSDEPRWIEAIEELSTYRRSAANEQVQSSRYNVKGSAALLKELYENA